VIRAVRAIACCVAAAAGCAVRHPPPPAHPHATVRPTAPSWPARPPDGTGPFWEDVTVPVVASGQVTAATLPLSVDQILRAPGIEGRWAAASDDLRDAVIARGFAVTTSLHPSLRVGDFYGALRDDRVPWVVTLDALFFFAHVAFERALAEVDSAAIDPSITTLLRHLDARLATEVREASPDLAYPFAVARGLVGVAIDLGGQRVASGPGLGPVIAAAVAAEQARVLAHTGLAQSPWLRAPVDYAAMSPRGVADRDADASARFRAVAWLSNAALALEATGERGARTGVDVATARDHARAALLLAHGLEMAVDRDAADAWRRIEHVGDLVIGPAADVSPSELAAAASRSGLDLRDVRWLADVVRVDLVRHAAARGHVLPTFRLLRPRTTPDGELLQSLSFPIVGPRNTNDSDPSVRSPDPSDVPVLPREGERPLPTALDVAAWLGSGEARAALHDSGEDAYEHYDEVLEGAMRMRRGEALPASSERHRTPYLSMIDALETWLGPSVGDAVQPSAPTSEWRKRKADVALAAWTDLRHDATAMTRAPAADGRLPPRLPGPETVPIFVEPHPEAIAKLVAFVRQTGRALVSQGMLSAEAPALRVIDAVDDLLWTALGAAVYEAADEALPAELEGALAAFPSRTRALEAVLADTGSADVPLTTAVHVDEASARVLEEATGRVEEAWMVMREPQTGRLWLAIGATIPHYEAVAPASQVPTDTAWRARIVSEGEPPTGPLARGYATLR
jgi:Protein of unknown function (DUF3160)